MSEENGLSVAIVTLNEELNLARTLASVVWASQIVVVDSGSTDRTISIAREFGAQVIERPWSGFAQQKNFAIEQCAGAWVLSLDADEELSSELQAEIRAIVTGTPEYDAYFLRRRNLFLDRWIKHGSFYPDAKLRLFRRYDSDNASVRKTLKFEERAVHETIASDRPTGTLRSDILHHAYPTLSSYTQHMDRYSTLGADILNTKGRVSRSLLSFALNVYLVPQFMFQWNYFIRLGFLDGREGLLLHLYHAVYTSWKYAKAWELGRHLRQTPAHGSTETVPK